VCTSPQLSLRYLQNSHFLTLFVLSKIDIVRHGGHITKCLEDRFDDVTIDDKLREMLVNEDDSENAFVFSEEEKSEFIYKIFKHLCVGGGICQVNDTQPVLLPAPSFIDRI
jgi:hypothetical protein